jgi:hypothetical protein
VFFLSLSFVTSTVSLSRRMYTLLSSLENRQINVSDWVHVQSVRKVAAAFTFWQPLSSFRTLSPSTFLFQLLTSFSSFRCRLKSFSPFRSPPRFPAKTNRDDHNKMRGTNNSGVCCTKESTGRKCKSFATDYRSLGNGL